MAGGMGGMGGGMGGMGGGMGGMGGGGGMFGGGYAQRSSEPLASGMGFFGSAETPRVLQLEAEATELKKQRDELIDRLNEINKRETALNEKEEELDESYRQLIEKEQEIQKTDAIARFAHSIDALAFENQQVFDRIKSVSDKPRCEAYVMSVDIRRSTDLMLKATTPQDFRIFITDVCTTLRDIIKRHCGVFDKFTGDGVLAFFPDFLSGSDAGLYALLAAAECHNVFEGIYRKHRRSFTAVLGNIGLGIGIDYGWTDMVEIFGNLTVVGTPVVYACRLGGGEPGTTLINQQAYAQLLDKHSEYCAFQETLHPIKHEGSLVAYCPRFNEKPFTPELPTWKRRSEQSKPQSNLQEAPPARGEGGVTKSPPPQSEPQPAPSTPSAPPPAEVGQ